MNSGNAPEELKKPGSRGAAASTQQPFMNSGAEPVKKSMEMEKKVTKLRNEN
jgi:hypothetical protein